MHLIALCSRALAILCGIRFPQGRQRFRLSTKTLLAMRLTIIFLTAAFLNVSAKGLSQSVTYSGRDVRLQEVFTAIRSQTGYVFFFDNDVIKGTRPVTLKVRNMPLEDLLALTLGGQGLAWSIKSKTIIVKRALPDPILAAARPNFLPITGLVKMADGKPVTGINVVVKGTHTGAVTDSEGKFVLNVPPGSTLVISGIGFETQEVKIGSEATLNITLQQGTRALDTASVMVSTGYQTISRVNSTGATVTVTGKELEKRYTPNIIDNLEGRVPGLVNYRGTTTIRGVSSLQSSTSALVVVDGLPIEGSVADINPYDIESVTVLKDAAAAAIYGARASNGVIVIVTRRAREKRTVVEVSSDMTVYQKLDFSKYHYVTAAQQVDLEKSFWSWYFDPGINPTNVQTVQSYLGKGNPITPIEYAYYQQATGAITQKDVEDQLAGFRKNNFIQQYKDNALKNEMLQQYNVAVRTSGGRLQSSLILNYKTDNMGIINEHNRQFNLFYKGTYDVSKWLDVDFGVNTILGQQKTSNSNFATSPFNVSPYTQLLDARGNRVYYTTSDYNMYIPQAPQLQSMLVNHLDELGKDFLTTTQQNTRYYVNMNFKILRGLTFRPQFQYEDNITDSSAYSESDSYVMRFLKNIYTVQSGTAPNYTYTDLLPASGGKLATTHAKGAYWTARAQADFNRQYGKHLINLIAGAEFRDTRVHGVKGLLLGYDDQLQSSAMTTVNYTALSALTSTAFFKPGYNPINEYTDYLSDPIGVIQDTTHHFGSGYANATYTYDRRYNVFGSYRKDYADVFGLDPKFRGRPLWSVGVGWNIFNESFLSDIKWVNYLKFRATYGVTGNINLNTTSFLTANSSLINPITGLPMAVVQNPANPKLTWEKTATTNLGLDFALFESRLRGSLDWYHKKGTNLFANQRLDPSEGFSSQVINNGGLLNTGVELSLGYSWLQPDRRDGLAWSTLLVVSENKNKITYVDEVANTPLALVEGGLKVGSPVRSLFSFQYKGLNDVGQPQFLKADGTLTTTALGNSDLSAIAYSGGQDPRTNLALTNEFYYKGFSLNILMVYYGGQYLRALQPDIVNQPSMTPLPSYVLNSWTPTNKNTDIPGWGQYIPAAPVPGHYMTYSDKFVYSGDFIKIRNVVLGYNLPAQVAKRISSSGVRLRFQLNNPKAVWMKNKVNIDPETGGAPLLTSYVFGLNVNF